jgi:hypothetical protein
LTLVATDAKLVAYAPGRMKAAEKSRARHLHIREPVFRLFGVPGNARAPHGLLLIDSYAQKESNGEDDSSEVRTEEFNGTCPELVSYRPGEGYQG